MEYTAPSVDGDTRAIRACYHDHCNFFWSLRLFSKPFRSLFVSMKMFFVAILTGCQMNFDETCVPISGT